MKKLLLSLTAVAVLGFSASAQTEQGKTILGGTASYQSQKVDGADRASQELNLVPSIGYFVSDNFALGTGIGYQFSKSAVASATGQNEAVVVSPFGRYYVDLNENFKFFGQASVPMAFGNVKSVNAEGDAGDKVGSSTSIGVALQPGFAYFPTKKLGIELSLNGLSYNNYKVEDGNGTELSSVDSFSIGTNFFSPQIGIQFHF